MTIPQPGYDQILLTALAGAALCHSLACARAGRAAAVVVTCGTLNDRGASLYARGALWRESWGHSYPLCGGCWAQARQVAIKYRPGLAVIDATGPVVFDAAGVPVTAQSAGGRE